MCVCAVWQVACGRWRVAGGMYGVYVHVCACALASGPAGLSTFDTHSNEGGGGQVLGHGHAGCGPDPAPSFCTGCPRGLAGGRAGGGPLSLPTVSPPRSGAAGSGRSARGPRVSAQGGCGYVGVELLCIPRLVIEWCGPGPRCPPLRAPRGAGRGCRAHPAPFCPCARPQ